jgi:hypothetical protein
MSARAQRRNKAGARQCRACRHFRNEPDYLEAAMPGLTALSSAYAAVRADDGLCLHHDTYLSARSTCAAFAALPDEAA